MHFGVNLQHDNKLNNIRLHIEWMGPSLKLNSKVFGVAVKFSSGHKSSQFNSEMYKSHCCYSELCLPMLKVACETGHDCLLSSIRYIT